MSILMYSRSSPSAECACSPPKNVSQLSVGTCTAALGAVRTGVLGVLTLGHFRPPIKSCAARLPSGTTVRKRRGVPRPPGTLWHALQRPALAWSEQASEASGRAVFRTRLHLTATPHASIPILPRPCQCANRRAAAGPSPTGSSSDEHSTHCVRPSGRRHSRPRSTARLGRVGG